MRFQKILFLAAACVLALPPVLAADIHVATTGSDLTGDGTPGNPYQTIAFAYEQAADLDTLIVAAGTYNECVFLSGLENEPFEQRSIHVRAEAFDAGDPSSRALTVIDGTGQCSSPFSTVNIGGAVSSIEGFTITGGAASGIFSIGGVTITNNVIAGNLSSSGGGIYAYPKACYYGSTTTTITNNTIEGNDVTSIAGYDFSGRGGGVFVRARPEAFRAGDPIFGSGCVGGSPSVNVQDNEIQNNTTEFDGAGVFVFTNTIRPLSSQVTVTQNLITNNTAGVAGGANPTTGYGGGIYATTYGYSSEQISIVDNQVLLNTATGYGGGIWAGISSAIYADHNVIVDENTVTENTAGLGGGMELSMRLFDLGATETATLVATDNTVSGNVATTSDLLGGAGGMSLGMFSQRTISPNVGFTVAENTIRSNSADVDGAGVEIRVISDAENVFDPQDTAIRPAFATLDFTNNLLALNTSSNTQGDGVGGAAFVFTQAFGEAVSTANLELNTFADNSSQIGAGGIEVESFTGFDSQFFEEGLGVVDLGSSIVSDNVGFGIGGPMPGDAGLLTPGSDGGDTANITVEVEYSDFFANSSGNYETWVVDRTGQNGNISVDPLLDTVTYVPAACSPTIDAANPTLDFSLEADPDGGRANMGHTGGTAAAAASLADPSGDAAVDGVDVLRLAVAWGSSFGNPRWDPLADLDGSGAVDGLDLALLAAGFGESCP